MDRESQPMPSSGPAGYRLAARLESLDIGQSAPDGFGQEVRKRLIAPLIEGMGKQPVRNHASEVYGDGSPSQWVSVDHRYLDVISALYNVDRDWLAGTNGIQAPNSVAPLAVNIRAPKTGTKVTKLRSAALSSLGVRSFILLMVAFLNYLCIGVTISMAITGKLEFWPGLFMIGLSLGCMVGLVFAGRELIRSLRTGFASTEQLNETVQRGLRLHLAGYLYEYLYELPQLTSGEITAVLHGTFPVDDDLIARLCTQQTRSRKELLHAALSERGPHS